MAAHKSRVVAIMPARNNARTLEDTLKGIPKGCVDEVILVDNHSRDDTVALARSLGLTVVCHDHDRGYGGSLKTCLTQALAAGADLILELHPDNQYDGRLIPDLIARAERGNCGIVMGSRFLPKERAREGGMPIWKYLSNRFLSAVNGRLVGVRLSEFHTGFRVYRAEFVRAAPFERNSNDFDFSFQIIGQAVLLGYGVAEIPAFSRYFEEASSNDVLGSIEYGVATLFISVQCWLHRTGLVRFDAFEAPAAALGPESPSLPGR